MLKTLENVIHPNFTAHGFVYGSKVNYTDCTIVIYCDIYTYVFCSVFQVTWADIGIYLLLDNLSEYFEFKISADDFPCLAKLHASVSDLPNIKKWIETRPKTVY